MSLVSQVAEVAGVTTADVIRVLSHGGTTQDDWAIAHAVQAVTGRSAYELMFTAGRSAEIAEIWAGSRADAAPVAPTNPRAVHDPDVVIYAENTSPDETRQIAPHHPGDHDDEIVEDTQEQDEQATADQLADTLLADLAEVLDDAPAAIRLTRAWTCPADARQSIVFALEIDPRHWVRARYQDRLQRHLATAA